VIHSSVYINLPRDDFVEVETCGRNISDKGLFNTIQQFVRSNTVYGRIFLLGRPLADKFEDLVVKSGETTTYSAAFTIVQYMKLAAVLKLPAVGHVTHFHRQRYGCTQSLAQFERNIHEKALDY